MRHTRTRQPDYPMDPDEYDISRTWQYLFDLEENGEVARNYDAFYNEPIIRSLLGRADERIENEIQLMSKKEAILLGKDAEEEAAKQAEKNQKKTMSHEQLEHMFNYISEMK